ncbi:MAG: hypothetical protein J07HX5_00431, partial [halophilic archaeon J07HX5]
MDSRSRHVIEERGNRTGRVPIGAFANCYSPLNTSLSVFVDSASCLSGSSPEVSRGLVGHSHPIIGLVASGGRVGRKPGFGRIVNLKLPTAVRDSSAFTRRGTSNH